MKFRQSKICTSSEGADTSLCVVFFFFNSGGPSQTRIRISYFGLGVSYIEMFRVCSMCK